MCVELSRAFFSKGTWQQCVTSKESVILPLCEDDTMVLVNVASIAEMMTTEDNPSAKKGFDKYLP